MTAPEKLIRPSDYNDSLHLEAGQRLPGKRFIAV
jgi:hypothetical protein